MSVDAALAVPATSDPAPTQQALVLIQDRSLRGVTTAANTVIAILTLPAITSYIVPHDCKLIPAGTYKVGDIVTS